MGGIAKAFKSLFGGGTPYKAADPVTPAAQAAPEDTTTRAQEEQPNDALRKRKRGKASLYVSQDSSGSGSGGTGLNL